MTGEATLYAYTVVHYPGHHHLEHKVPYFPALVDTVEGVRLMTDVLDCAPQDLRIGMALTLVAEPLSDEVGLVHAYPAVVTKAGSTT